ncbi:MAG: hypothetical protein D6798_15560 [Deltaproteobacteria bacterium]|nr:MAG: hypothetical protein D6798_15560 [Deltaproteobacteria bacterium]
MLLSLLLPLSACALEAFALDGIALDPPQPIRGDPVDAAAVAWDLPRQDPAWLTDDTETLRCTVVMDIAADGGHVDHADDCPEAMRIDAIDAASRWRFAPLAGAEATRVTVTFVVRYSAPLSTMTLHAELDPGVEAARAGLAGRPGLRLVHEGGLVAPLVRRMPRAARKAGLPDTTCHLRARVTRGGQASQVLVEDCPPELATDAQKRVLRARFEPTLVDGQPQEDVLDVTVSYQR